MREKNDFSPGKAHFFFVSVTIFSTGSGSKKVVQEIFFEFGLYTYAFSDSFFFLMLLFTPVSTVYKDLDWRLSACSLI